MADIYVAGPVIRPGAALPPWVQAAYAAVRQAAQAAHADVIFPEREDSLERAEPRAFYDSISGRISGAEIAVVIFTGPDVSGGIEATMAANLDKPIAIVAADLQIVPRLLAGLPTVEEVVLPNADMPAVLRRFIRRNIKGPALSTV